MTEDKNTRVTVPERVTVRELADLIEVSPIAVIKQLMANGVIANINQQIDYETAAIVAEEMGVKLNYKLLNKNQKKSLVLHYLNGARLLKRKMKLI